MMKQFKTTQFGMASMFYFIVFVAVLTNAVLTAVLTYLLVSHGIMNVTGVTPTDAGRLLTVYILFSVPGGCVIALVASKVPLRPVRDLISSMNRLASGDFKTRVNIGSFMRLYPPFVEVVKSFNKMAEQLENTEMLRGDFVNNFSHEFKTPIVSIAGFAKLLRRNNLTEEKRQEYLGIIEEESLRLSYMATNVLNLTKVENQTILTEISEFNLSEQIRSSLLILERKWASRDLDFQLEFGEHMIRGNEELLKQVWINLLENAIKFAPDGNRIQVAIRDLGTALQVDVTNTGTQIPLEQQEKIFNKFYQADESHSTQGNGVGLAIVRQIIHLHGGNVKVRSMDTVTTFTVELPKVK